MPMDLSAWAQPFVYSFIALIGRCLVSSTYPALLKQYPSERKLLISILLKVPDQECTINTTSKCNVDCPYVYSVMELNDQ